MKHQHQLVHDRERYAQTIMDAKSIRIPKRSLLDQLMGRPVNTEKIPLASVCDFEELGSKEHGRKLILYVFDSESSIAEWRKIRRLRSIDTTEMDEKSYQKLIDRVAEMALTNQQLGVKKQSWFYTSMTVSLDFG